MLATCFLVLLFNGGARFAIGLLLPPMAEDLEWSRSALSLNVTLFMVLFAGSLFFVGWLVDRIGAARVLGAAVIVSAVGLASTGFAERPWQALLFYGVVFALGSAGTSITPIGVLLSRWYPHRMGMANSIAISGMGLGQLLVISVLTAQLAALGWRGSFLALGAAMLVCVLPLIPIGRIAAGPTPGLRSRRGLAACAAAGTGGGDPPRGACIAPVSGCSSSFMRSAVSRSSSSPPMSSPSRSTRGWTRCSPETSWPSWAPPASSACC